MQVSGQLEAPAASPPSDYPQYPLDSWLGGPQSWFGRCGEGKDPVLSEIEPQSSSHYDDGAIPANHVLK
jgi:hypothetical protein